jgi:RNA polymerase sigma-70 factor (sigma-E family)
MTTGRRWGGSSGDDELLSRLYQQLTDQQAARFGGEYDIVAGLDRYQAWLRDHAAGNQAGQEAIHAGTVMAIRASAAATGAAAGAPGPGQTVTAGGHAWSAADVPGGTRAIEADWDADRAVTRLYSLHYRSLVGLAAMLVGEVATAEEVVQDSFVALHGRWRRLADDDRALSYLRSSVVNRCRSVLRHRMAVDKAGPAIASVIAGAAPGQVTPPGQSALLLALRDLPPLQREVVVLRYYANLSEAQIAATMGISAAAVKDHTARAMSRLQAQLRLASE